MKRSDCVNKTTRKLQTRTEFKVIALACSKLKEYICNLYWRIEQDLRRFAWLLELIPVSMQSLSCRYSTLKLKILNLTILLNDMIQYR